MDITRESGRILITRNKLASALPPCAKPDSSALVFPSNFFNIIHQYMTTWRFQGYLLPNARQMHQKFFKASILIGDKFPGTTNYLSVTTRTQLIWSTVYNHADLLLVLPVDEGEILLEFGSSMSFLANQSAISSAETSDIFNPLKKHTVLNLSLISGGR